MIMSLSLHRQSAIGLLASPRYTNRQRAWRHTSMVVWKMPQHHCIFILITVIIILITILSIDIVIYHCINRHQPLYPSASRPTPRLYRGGRGALAFSFIITSSHRSPSSSRLASDVPASPGRAGFAGFHHFYNHTTVICYRLHRYRHCHRNRLTTILIVFTVFVSLSLSLSSS